MQGLMRMRGSARGVDLVTLLYENRKVIHCVGAIESLVSGKKPMNGVVISPTV